MTKRTYRFLNKDHSLVMSDDGHVIQWDVKGNCPAGNAGPDNVEQDKIWRDAGSPSPMETGGIQPAITPSPVDEIAVMPQPDIDWASASSFVNANDRIQRGIDAASQTLNEMPSDAPNNITDLIRYVQMLTTAVRAMIAAERAPEPKERKHGRMASRSS